MAAGDVFGCAHHGRQHSQDGQDRSRPCGSGAGVSKEAAQAIQGKPLNEETAMAAANAALAPAKSLGQNKYKITVAKAAVKRALLAAGKSQSAHLGGHRHDAHA